MNLVVNNSALLLDRWQTVALIDAAGVTAALDKGCVWITMDGDRRDIVLSAGQSWTVERNGRTLLHAEAPSTLRITDPAVDQAHHPALPRALAAVTDWVKRTFRRASAPYY
jgi:Protein of unknown function (DUF2917)